MPDKPPNELVLTGEAVPDQTVIWRYIKFERFVDILKTHSFWFSRPFRFDDKWDGFFPPSYAKVSLKQAHDLGIPIKEVYGDLQRRILSGKYANFVNCWHMSDHESDVMWTRYAQAQTGIAIQSTVGGIKKCFPSVHSGPVIYFDPSQVVRFPSVVPNDFQFPDDIRFKRIDFELDKEYRLWLRDWDLFQRIEAGEEVREKDLSTRRLEGLADMESLIEKIVVAPGASGEFIEQVRAACAEVNKRWLWPLIERSSSDRTWDSFTGYDRMCLS